MPAKFHKVPSDAVLNALAKRIVDAANAAAPDGLSAQTVGTMLEFIGGQYKQADHPELPTQIAIVNAESGELIAGNAPSDMVQEVREEFLRQLPHRETIN